MKPSRSGVVTLLFALSFVASLGFSVWTWTSYAAHDGSLQQAGDALAGMISAMCTVGFGAALWLRFTQKKDREADDIGKHPQ